MQGAPGHRQDRGRPAPCGVPALLPPRPALPPGRAGRRAERLVPALHRRRAARARRDRRAADHDRGAGRQDAGPAQREVRRSAAPTAPRSRPSRATAGWRRSCAGRCGRRCRPPPRACSCRAARGAGGWRRTRWRRCSRRCARAGCGTARPAGCSPQRAGAPDPGQDGARRRLPRRPGAGRGGAQPPGEEVRRPGVAGRRPGAAGAAAARRRGATSPASADGILTEDEQALLLWDKPFKAPDVGEVVAGRRGADRRGRRPRGAHPVARPRRRRRGAGPLADDAAGRRPALLDRVRDRARRPRAGHHALGDPLVGRGARHLGKPDAHIEQLTEGFRVPGEVIEYAARLLPAIAPGLEPPTSVRRTRGELDVDARDDLAARSTDARRRHSPATARSG